MVGGRNQFSDDHEGIESQFKVRQHHDHTIIGNDATDLFSTDVMLTLIRRLLGQSTCAHTGCTRIGGIPHS